MHATSSTELGDGQMSFDLPAQPLNNVTWSENGLVAMLDGMLHSQLRQFLDSRLSPAARQELIDWIAAPLLPDRQAIKQPFSFQCCCYAAGVEPEEMQRLTLRRVAPDRFIELFGR